MTEIALLTFSDGRDYVHRDLAPFVESVEERLVEHLERAGHQVHRAEAPVTSNGVAVREARRLAATRHHVTIVNYPVWALRESNTTSGSGSRSVLRFGPAPDRHGRASP